MYDRRMRPTGTSPNAPSKSHQTAGNMLPQYGFIFVPHLEPRISRRALRWPDLLSDVGVFDGVRGGRRRESSVGVGASSEASRPEMCISSIKYQGRIRYSVRLMLIRWRRAGRPNAQGFPATTVRLQSACDFVMLSFALATTPSPASFKASRAMSSTHLLHSVQLGASPKTNQT